MSRVKLSYLLVIPNEYGSFSYNKQFGQLSCQTSKLQKSLVRVFVTLAQ
jgi:hypothetical protein